MQHRGRNSFGFCPSGPQPYTLNPQLFPHRGRNSLGFHPHGSQPSTLNAQPLQINTASKSGALKGLNTVARGKITRVSRALSPPRVTVPPIPSAEQHAAQAYSQHRGRNLCRPSIHYIRSAGPHYCDATWVKLLKSRKRWAWQCVFLHGVPALFFMDHERASPTSHRCTSHTEIGDSQVGSLRHHSME